MAGFGYNIAPGTSAESIALKRRLAQQMMAPNKRPLRHWLQGVSEIGEGLMGGYMANQANKADATRTEQTQRMLSGLFGLGDEAAQMPAAQPAPNAPTDIRPPAMGGDMGAYGSAISGIESGGDYAKLGPVTGKGDRAYGKYQVMGENIGPWTKEVLGQEMKPDDFLANPEAQDAVFNAKFGQYTKKYGPEGAARAWFAGEGGMNDMGRKDQLGTSVSDYAKKFNRGVRRAGTPAAQAAPRVASKEKRRLRQAIAMIGNPDTAALGNKILADYLTRGTGDTSAIKEFRLAQQQGYEGSFLDYRKELKSAGASKTNIQFGGKKLSEELSKGVAKDLLTEREAARDAVSSLEATVETRGLLDSGIISGFGSNFILGMGKALQKAGINIAEDPITNTETFVATRAQEVGRIIKLFGAGTGLSDADRAYASKAAAGDIALNETSIRKILEINERAARNVIKSYNESVDKIPEGTAEYDLSIQLPESLAEKPEARESSRGGPQVGQSIDAEQLQGLPDNTIIEDEAGNQFKVMGGTVVPIQ